MGRRLLPLRWMGPFLVCASVCAVLATAAAEAASSDIANVWSFHGGAIAVQATADGSFQATVVTPTTFATCTHPAGEVAWTQMRLQPDGSYWGLDQWETGGTCVPQAVGPTAWRILTNAAGARFLRVCFSDPGRTQPTIAPDGTAAGDTFGCLDSALLAAVPVVAATTPPPVGGATGPTGSTGSTTRSPETISFAGIVGLPGGAKCVRGGRLKLALHIPTYDPLARILLKMNGRVLFDVQAGHRLRDGFTLRGLPHGRYTLRIELITVLKQHLFGARHYHSCH